MKRRAAFALAGLTAALAAVQAPADDAPWDARLPVYLSTTVNYQQPDGAKGHAVMVAGLMELQLRRRSQPWTVGPIAEVRRILNPKDTTIVSAGMIFRHRHGRWDTTALLYRQMPDSGAYTWNYGSRLRYRFCASGKFGAEMFGPVDNMASPTLMFGYYGTVTKTLSLRLAAGATVNQSDSRRARLDLVWQVH